jgi:hypothetical protein
MIRIFETDWKSCKVLFLLHHIISLIRSTRCVKNKWQGNELRKLIKKPELFFFDVNRKE